MIHHRSFPKLKSRTEKVRKKKTVTFHPSEKLVTLHHVHIPRHHQQPAKPALHNSKHTYQSTPAVSRVSTYTHTHSLSSHMYTAPTNLHVYSYIFTSANRGSPIKSARSSNSLTHYIHNLPAHACIRCARSSPHARVHSLFRTTTIPRAACVFTFECTRTRRHERHTRIAAAAQPPHEEGRIQSERKARARAHHTLSV